MPSPRAGDIGRLGIHLPGRDDDLIVGASLGFVAGHHITVAEIAEGGWNSLPLARVDGTIRLDGGAGEHLAIDQSVLFGVTADQNGIPRSQFNLAGCTDPEFVGMPGGIEGRGL